MKMVSQLFSVLALVSAVQGSQISLGELGEVDVPDELEKEIYQECVPLLFDRDYESHIHRVARRVITAKEEAKEQIVKCATNELHVGRLECISDHVIAKTYSHDAIFQELVDDDPCNHDNSVFEIATVCLNRHSSKKSEARIKLLESAQQEKEYFRSHLTAFKRAEQKRIKWQCKNFH